MFPAEGGLGGPGEDPPHSHSSGLCYRLKDDWVLLEYSIWASQGKVPQIRLRGKIYLMD